MKGKRVIALFCVLLLMFGLIMLRLVLLAKPGNKYSSTAQYHGSYNLKLNTTRGTIYDTAMNPLVNTESDYLATVAPITNTGEQLSALMPQVSDLQSLEAKLAERLPFFIKVKSSSITAKGVKIVKTIARYSDNAIAPHIIGYLDSDGNGVSGIEKTFNSELSSYSEKVTASFPVDATGRSLSGLSADINVEGNGESGGVVLTIDKNIQQAAQQAANKYLKAGAVVVMNPKNGDILACVSNPTFSQNKLESAVNGTDSPMLNRAFAAYDVGSVFKIAVAATALESGVSSSFSVDCTGTTEVAGKSFKDEKTSGHGTQDMASGLANSCNVYYITLGQKLGADKLLSMARKLGFGQTNEFAPGYGSSQGELPTGDQLSVPAALANFSIGQGDFMATPVQIARMVCAVANGGMMPTPRLVKSLVDNDKKTVKSYSTATPDRVFSQSTASQLQQFMIKTVNEGTGTPAMPAYGGAGGKTATAETGWVKNGKTMNQAWFAGFYPAQNPQYVIVALLEDGVAGGTDAGPVFKYIANSLAPSCGYPTVSQ